MKEKYLRDYLNINKYKDGFEIIGYSTGSDNNFEDEYLSGYNNKSICYDDFLDILSKNSKNIRFSPENPVEKAARELREKAVRRDKKIDDILGDL